jgi:hypothetical protein
MNKKMSEQKINEEIEMNEPRIAKTVSNTMNGWNDALRKMQKIASYKKFFEITSKHAPIVVKNDSTFYKINKKGNCHINCKLAEEDGLGKRVSGWYVMNEFTHEAFVSGMCRIVHHSNLLLRDGSLVNITRGGEDAAHIFIQDDLRDFDFVNRVGYNDRMVFGDDFFIGRTIPRNKVHFAAKGEFDRDITFEKFKIYASKLEALKTIPKSLPYQKQIKWMTLKTTCYLE